MTRDHNVQLLPLPVPLEQFLHILLPSALDLPQHVAIPQHNSSDVAMVGQWDGLYAIWSFLLSLLELEEQ